MEEMQMEVKFCKYCGEKIPKDAVLCTYCGRQVEQLKFEHPNVVINNTNSTVYKGQKNKWIALLLCLFLGLVGAHKFYEGKILLGLLYIFTGGFFAIGWILDIISLLFKPNPYYV